MTRILTHAIAEEPTPILNTPDFNAVFGGKDGCTLPLEGSLKLLKAMEFIALKGTKFQILADCGNHILKVKTVEYQETSLYADARFLRPVEAHFLERAKILPSPAAILEMLPGFIGLDYVWGGNWSQGIDRMKLLYPWKQTPSERETLAHWLMRGVDCSGLLYEATNGWTPRNTSELLRLGKEVSVEGCSKETIASYLQPLDLIVWPGHVIIVLNSEETIESLGGKGVIRMRTLDRLEEVMQVRQPHNAPSTSDPYFLVRRWHPSLNLSE